MIDKSEIKLIKDSKHTKKLWWNEKCSEKVAIMIQKTRNFQRIGTQEAFEEMRAAERDSKRVIKDTRRTCWRKKCSEITQETPISEIWQMAHHFATGKRSKSTKIDDEELLQKFADKNSPADNQEEINFGEFESEHEVIKKIGCRELKQRIHNLKKSACGMDRISAQLLKELPNFILNIVTNIFNEIIVTKQVPTDFLNCKIVAILKPRKPSHEPNSYRPIAIFSSLRRIFDSLLLKRLEWWAETKDILSPTQYGFRKGRGTRDCLAILATKIKIAFAAKQVVVAAFCDISNAYGEVHVPSLIRSLDGYGLPANFCELLWNLMKQKESNYLLNGEVKAIRLTRTGLSQGLPLSCILYNLDTAEVDKVLDEG